MNEKANIGSIFGTALFGVVDDLAKAKENGQTLPGLLDNVAGLALTAKQKGIDLAKEEAKVQAFKYLPWGIAGVLVIVVVLLIAKR